MFKINYCDEICRFLLKSTKYEGKQEIYKKYYCLKYKENLKTGLLKNPIKLINCCILNN